MMPVKGLGARWHVRPHLAFAIGCLAAHSIAVMANVGLLVFFTGVCLVFIVPGSLAVYGRRGGIVPGISFMERIALSAVLSIGYIAIAALVLDLTPLGITHPSLLGAIWVAAVIAATVESIRRVTHQGLE